MIEANSSESIQESMPIEFALYRHTPIRQLSFAVIQEALMLRRRDSSAHS
jgi:hypothetical protein